MVTKKRIQKYVAAFFLGMLFCAPSAFAATKLPGQAVNAAVRILPITGHASVAENNKSFNRFVISTNKAAVAPSYEITLLELANGIFAGKQTVYSQRVEKESTWSIAPMLEKMTLSSLLGDQKNFGLVWKYRF